jgi:hypothetical protein
MVFDLSNLPYWILLGIGVALYLFVILSGGGDDDLDIDADADVDLDIDADLDVDADLDSPVDFDADTDAEGFSAGQILGWFGIGKAPLILLLATDLSLWGISGWFLNVVVGGVLGSIASGVIGGAILVGSLIMSLLMGSAIARPVGKIFASFGEDTSSDRLVGCIATVSTGKIPRVQDRQIGQVDVLDPARNLVTVNAVLPDWANVMPNRGEKVLVIDRSDSTYIVIAKDSPDQDRWFSEKTPKKFPT